MLWKKVNVMPECSSTKHILLSGLVQVILPPGFTLQQFDYFEGVRSLFREAFGEPAAVLRGDSCNQ